MKLMSHEDKFSKNKLHATIVFLKRRWIAQWDPPAARGGPFMWGSGRRAVSRRPMEDIDLEQQSHARRLLASSMICGVAMLGAAGS
jgi:hypothetical protein